jgi:hypothetical protein
MPKQQTIEPKGVKHHVALPPGTYFVCFHNGEPRGQWRWHFVEGKTIDLEIEPRCTVVVEKL